MAYCPLKSCFWVEFGDSKNKTEAVLIRRISSIQQSIKKSQSSWRGSSLGRGLVLLALKIESSGRFDGQPSRTDRLVVYT